jgi:16S rRNA (cytosine967-C5)-methyltransferase
MAALMQNEGEIVSVDKSAWKLEELKENAERQGVRIIRPLAADAVGLSPAETGRFDRVLVDAPCSGFGAVRRKPDIKWTRHPKDPYRFARVQKEILAHAAGFVKDGGILVYATCTIFREENEEVIEDFVSNHPEWQINPAADFLPKSCESMVDRSFYRSWPHRHGIDGFFGARLVNGG